MTNEGAGIDYQERMRSIHQRLQNLKRFLEETGYIFDSPAEVLPGVSSCTETVLSRITDAAGTIPEALVAFYREIGSVNFCGHHPAWTEEGYPDPLVIFPPDYALDELENYLDDKAEYTGTYGSFRIPIAPDYFHKAGVSGGMWYGIAVPGSSANPLVLEEFHGLNFIEYLELNLMFGGFLGLEEPGDFPGWPIEALRTAAT